MSQFDSVRTFYTYPEFVKLAETLLAEGKTTGPDQSEEMIGYTKLNLHRMHRWEKTYQVPETLKNVLEQADRQTWWVITEAWCGDSAQLLTQLYRMAEASGGKITLKIILRDEHPTIMDQYLTNGSRSIPKLISLDEAGLELFTWGPRPLPVQQVVVAWKADHAGRTYEDIKNEVHHWYGIDKGATLGSELSALLSKNTPSN